MTRRDRRCSSNSRTYRADACGDRKGDEARRAAAVKGGDPQAVDGSGTCENSRYRPTAISVRDKVLFAGMGCHLELSLTLDSVAMCVPGHERLSILVSIPINFDPDAQLVAVSFI